MTNRHPVLRRAGALVVAIAAAAGPALAAGLPGLDDYGSDDVNVLWVQAPEFVCSLPGTGEWSFVTRGFWYNSGALNSIFFAPVHLPTGALVTGMTIVYDDDDPAGGADITVRLLRNWIALGSANSTVVGTQFTSAGDPDLSVDYHDIVPDHVIAYFNPINLAIQSYELYLGMPNSSLVSFQGVRIHWYRQVSPAPASATFSDVPTGYWAFRHIEALADSGITAGCGGGSFCPEAPITRAQMAVFLAKALGLHWSP